jgi:L-lactate dehydrogenase
VFLQIIGPERFGGHAAFLRETGFFARYCRETPVPPGKPPVRLPGQAALSRPKKQLATGVALYPSILPALVPWAKSLSAPLPTPLVG